MAPLFSPNQKVGRYTLIRKIGEGGYGSVWLAENRTDVVTTEVAIKFVELKHDNDFNPDLTEIKKEAQIWQLAGKHPNLHSLIEADVYDESPALVTEFAPDGSLGKMIRDSVSSISVETASTIILGILSGLRHLHNRAILHRDLKPDNILLFEGTPRITDFGLSRSRGSANTSGGKGTLAYKAPEAFEGIRTEQTDLWAVGIIFYEMLVGDLPFPSHDDLALMNAIVNKEHTPLPSSIPIPIQNIINRALEKDLGNRYQRVSEMFNDLQKAFNSTLLNPQTNQSTIEAEVTKVDLSVKTVVFNDLIKGSSFTSITTVNNNQFTDYVGLSSDGKYFGFKVCYLTKPERIYELVTYLKSIVPLEIKARSLSSYSVYITGDKEEMKAITVIFRNARQSTSDIVLHLITIENNKVVAITHF